MGQTRDDALGCRGGGDDDDDEEEEESLVLGVSADTGNDRLSVVVSVACAAVCASGMEWSTGSILLLVSLSLLLLLSLSLKSVGGFKESEPLVRNRQGLTATAPPQDDDNDKDGVVVRFVLVVFG